MSKLMWIAGILLAAAGVALGLMVLVSPASVAAVGVTLDAAVTLLVGGILSLGLGSVITLLGAQHQALSEGAGHVVTAAAPPAPIPEFGRKASEAAPAAAAVAAVAVASAEAEEEVSEPTRGTIEALEEARQKIEQAFEPKPAEPEVIEAAAVPEPEPEVEPEPAPHVEAEAVVVTEEVAAAEEETAPEEELAEGQLYVVEERYIRMRPARILSDGTVEAETAEGWMRFENLEHLDEYLDAMEPAKS